ncbi:MAG: 3-isopropylmalate dehydratase small subunit [Dehalococcoidaceae bacterium]|nr:3-isopropylmalate dehydratase small subunit [Dehalococcoidaceae bacterium]
MISGRVYKYGDNVDTDAIIPARYLNVSDPAELAVHCMEDIDVNFAGKVQAGDIIMAGANFGCGSSREHAPLCISAAGVSCVIACTFARIFFRNAINIGLALLECPEAVENTSDGDRLEVELETGNIRNLSTGKIFEARPYPEFMRGIIKSGGLIQYTRQQLSARQE